MLGGRVLTREDGMSDSLGEFFRRFNEALARWERDQSAPSLVEVVREARHKQPSGYAIVQAAVDWELAGFDQLPYQRPISEEDLRALFPSYLAELEPSRPLRRRKVVPRDAKPQDRCAESVSGGRDAQRAQPTRGFQKMTAC